MLDNPAETVIMTTNAQQLFKHEATKAVGDVPKALWSLLATAVNPSAEINDEQQRFVVESIDAAPPFLGARSTIGIHQLITPLATYVNTCHQKP